MLTTDALFAMCFPTPKIPVAVCRNGFMDYSIHPIEPMALRKARKRFEELLLGRVEADKPGARQGKNDFGSDNVGYRGPMPPKGSGPHRYFFKVYALDRPLDLAAKDANKKSLLAAMKGHILGEGQLIGTFESK